MRSNALRIQKNAFFPKLDRGFWADLNTSTEELRLFAHINEIGWATSVYNKRTKEWIAESGLAKDAADAKCKAEHIARQLLPGTYQIEWRGVGCFRP